MNNRQRMLAVLNYEPYDRMPVIHFGFLDETLLKWGSEGHLDAKQLEDARKGSGSLEQEALDARLGFDCPFERGLGTDTRIRPAFESRLIETMPDGTRKILNGSGVVVINKDDCGSIPMEVDHILKDRKSWEEEFLHRLQFSKDRVDGAGINNGKSVVPFNEGGLDYLKDNNRDRCMYLYCGSLYGVLRDYMGMENLCYLAADDPDLLDEMIEVNADLCYRAVEYVLSTGAIFDIGHFWEDICFKNGPLVNPEFFHEKVGPYYKRITDLLHKHGVNLISLDCDGCIDKLVPTWIENGVNVMFPIEVGTWNADIRPWREQFGKELRGIGGMNKRVFSYDYAAVDSEIERLKALVDLGGYIPCPDHRIADDAKWENVQYYCDKMRKAFGG